jgi:malonyl CoA-acyl carrier protein transacylase
MRGRSCWSGRRVTWEARTRLTGLMAGHIDKGAAMADLAWSLQTGRIAMPERAALAVRDGEDAAAAFAAGKRIRTGSAGERPRLAFLFPGQGAQFAGMGASLYRDEPVFAATIDAAAARLDFDLKALLFEGGREQLAQTGVTQPAVFAVSVATLRLLADWGLRPDVVIGHSLGEYAAMVAAGVLEFEAALDLVAARGRLMQALPGGQMAAALAPVADVLPHLAKRAEIAAINSPGDCVVSGPTEAIAATLAALDRAGIAARPLETSHAFHSAMLDPMLPEFARLVAATPRAEPGIPLISNLTGQSLTDLSPDYFTAQIRQPVRFADGIAALLADGPVVALEVGPGTVLGGLGRRQGLRSLATLPMGGDRQALLDAMGSLWCEGFDLDWSKLHTQPRRRVDLPAYPFARTRHWITPTARKQPADTGVQVRYAGWRRHHAMATALPEGDWAVAGSNPEPLRRALDALGTGSGAAPDGLIVTDVPAEALPAILAEALAGGRLRQCLFVLNGLADVQGTERLDSNAARLAGLALALARERPEVAVRILDPGDGDPTAMLPSLLAGPMPLSAWRGRSVWVPEFPAMVWPEAAGASDGAWLVIGATGLIGRTAATAIRSARPDAPLYLASRSGGAVAGVTGETRAVDAAAIKPLIDEIVARHGWIAGIVHAAGTLGTEAFAAVTDPLPTGYADAKIGGVAALAAALDGVACGFVALCGSLSARLGGVGYGSYAGANLAAAGIAANAGRGGRTAWITLALDAVAGGPSPGFGLAEISRDALASLFTRLVESGALLGSVELIVAPGDMDARWAEFAETIGRGVALTETAITENDDPLAAAWCAILGTDSTDEEDSFFAAGGSSLQALQLLARLRRELGVEMALGDFFDAPTLAGLRARLIPTEKAELILFPARTGPAPLSAGQLGLWLAEQSGRAGRFNITGLYRVEGPLDLPAFTAALGAVEARHEALRTRFVEQDGAPVQLVDPPGRVPLSEERIAPGALEARLAEEVTWAFDLAAEPAWRVVLLDGGAEGQHLLLSAHHILLDDWSIGLLFADLAEAYATALAGKAPTLPTAPGFTDHCRDQEAAGQSALLEQWREALEDAPRTIPFARPIAAEPDGALRIGFDGATVAALRQLAEANGTSLFTVMLAALKASLAGETGSRDLVVGTPMTGRPPQHDGTLGYFVNPAALRTDLAATPDFTALVRAVRTTVLDAAARDSLPYEHVTAHLGAASLFNAWFTILTHAVPPTMAGGLRLDPVRVGLRPARFDLALILEPEGEGLTGWLEYDGTAVGMAAAERIAARIARIVTQVIADPAAPLSTLLGQEEAPLRLALPRGTRRRGAIDLIGTGA